MKGINLSEKESTLNITLNDNKFTPIFHHFTDKAKELPCVIKFKILYHPDDIKVSKIIFLSDVQVTSVI